MQVSDATVDSWLRKLKHSQTSGTADEVAVQAYGFIALQQLHLPQVKQASLISAIFDEHPLPKSM